MDVQSIGINGVTPTYAAVATSEVFDNDGRVLLSVKNGGASSITVTVVDAVPCNYGYTHDVTVDVAAGGEVLLGVFSPGRFNENGQVTVQFSDNTSVTAAAFRF